MPRIIAIFGPTSSGKSALAQALAGALDGIVINSDALQLYRELRILTARPTPREEAALPHRLYGVLPASEAASAGRWLALARPVIEQAWQEGKLPIVVGGTGLYLKTLMEGLSPIPDVPQETRDAIRARYPTGEALYAALQVCDPLMASRLQPGDTQRVARAVEVMEATGRSLAQWQQEPRQPPFPQARFMRLGMDIPRELLYARCDARFEAMLQAGGLEEARALHALRLPRHLPSARAVGVAQLLAHLEGEYPLEEAVAKAKQATRNYAKRQLTWMRHQLPAAQLVPHDLLENPAAAAQWLEQMRLSL